MPIFATICHNTLLLETARNYSHYLHYSLFETIRCSVFETIRYSLFAFSRHPLLGLYFNSTLSRLVFLCNTFSIVSNIPQTKHFYLKIIFLSLLKKPKLLINEILSLYDQRRQPKHWKYRGVVRIAMYDP